MREFTPTHTQRADLAVEMAKLTKDSYGNAVVAFIISAAILAALIFAPDVPIFVWIIMSFFVGIGIYGGVNAVTHRKKSLECSFSNYTYYLCTATDKKTTKSQKSSTGGRSSRGYLLYLVAVANNEGGEDFIPVNDDLYKSIEVGDEFILAKYKSVEYKFKNTFIKLEEKS